MQKRLFLLDAYALIYKAFYAFIKNPRITSSGINTSAVYGFVNILNDVIENEKPTHIAVVFDPPGGTFRHKEYPAYKANRPPTPEGIQVAIPFIKQILDAYQIPVVEILNYEADDTIGTLAKKAEKEGFTVYMMTPDKDYCQLVSENIFIYKPKRSGNENEIWGVKEVCNEFNVDQPTQVIDVLAMWGDSSDNVPGIDGVGEKKAKDFVKRYKSVEGLFEHIGEIQGKLREKILASKELALRAKHLVTIVIDVDVEFNAENYRLKEKNIPQLIPIFEKLEFRTMLARLGVQPAAPKTEKQPENKELSLFDLPPVQTKSKTTETASDFNEFSDINSTEHEYILADTVQKRIELIELLTTQTEFCFDTETTGLDVHSAELVGMSFACQAHKAWYVPVPAKRSEALKIVAEFKNVLENEHSVKIGQNLKFDIMMLHYYGVDVKGKLFDTMIAHYLISPDQRHGMDALAEQYLNYSPVPITQLIGEKGKNQISMRQVALDKICEYAAEDADITLQLKAVLEPMITEAEMISLFYDVEMPLVYVLAQMEVCGFRLDVEALNEYSKVLSVDIEQLEKEIFEMAGIHFNISSPKQLGEILFERMKIIDNPNLTKTKQYATGEQELQKIADKHPIIRKLLEFRSLKKLLSTYVETLPLLIHQNTGKIHTSFNQAVVATGRLSSNNPNLQNIPIRTEKGREIRKSFIASSPEHLIVSADYSQIELRLIAHISNDANMIEAFRNQEDIHTATAAKIYGISQSEVTKEMRSRAKSANFGIVYGISSFGLAQNLAISRAEAKLLIDGYFNTYPTVKTYMDKSIAQARRNKYVKTILGRRRDLADIESQNQVVRGIAERNAINAPIQGSAADVIKIAMVNIFRQFNQQKLQTKMILQVHDELIFDVYKPELEQVKQIIAQEMENALPLNVPLTIEMGIGNNWLEAH